MVELHYTPDEIAELTDKQIHGMVAMPKRQRAENQHARVHPDDDPINTREPTSLEETKRKTFAMGKAMGMTDEQLRASWQKKLDRMNQEKQE